MRGVGLHHNVLALLLKIKFFSLQNVQIWMRKLSPEGSVPANYLPLSHICVITIISFTLEQ